MNAVYKEVFRVSLKHPYYRSGFCEDFDFLPTTECLKTMSRFGLLFRKNNHGISVVASVSVDNSGEPVKPFKPFIVFDEVIKLEFAMVLKNYRFLNITKSETLKNSDFKNLVYHYSNSPGATELSSLTIRTSPSWFTYKFSSAVRSIVNIELLDENKNILSGKEITESDFGKRNFSYTVNLSGYNSGIYALRVPVENIEETFYVNDELFKKAIYGIISLRSEPGNLFDPANPADYEISFEVLEKQWKYYVISKTAFDSLKLVDSADSPKYHFLEVTPSPVKDSRYFKSVIGPAGANEDDKEWPFSEDAVAGIQLIDGDRVLVENASVPNMNNPKAEIYIYV